MALFGRRTQRRDTPAVATIPDLVSGARVGIEALTESGTLEAMQAQEQLIPSQFQNVPGLQFLFDELMGRARGGAGPGVEEEFRKQFNILEAQRSPGGFQSSDVSVKGALGLASLVESSRERARGGLAGLISPFTLTPIQPSQAFAGGLDLTRIGAGQANLGTQLASEAQRAKVAESQARAQGAISLGAGVLGGFAGLGLGGALGLEGLNLAKAAGFGALGGSQLGGGLLPVTSRL